MKHGGFGFRVEIVTSKMRHGGFGLGGACGKRETCLGMQFLQTCGTSFIALCSCLVAAHLKGYVFCFWVLSIHENRVPQLRFEKLSMYHMGLREAAAGGGCLNMQILHTWCTSFITPCSPLLGCGESEGLRLVLPRPFKSWQ